MRAVLITKQAGPVRRSAPGLFGKAVKVADAVRPGDDNAEPSLTDWQNALKPMPWAIEIRPNDNGLNARAKYIEGRIAFISNLKDQALELWKKASDLDSAWAMPPNGIGVIYNEKKSFEFVKPMLVES